MRYLLLTILNLIGFSGLTQNWIDATPFNDPDGPVHCMVTYQNSLIIGGEFNQCGGLVTTKVASWNGSNWTSMSNGINATVNSLIVYNNELYAGASTGLWKWSGVAWVSTSLSGNVSDMEIWNNQLVVGGSNLSTDGSNFGSIYTGNGSSWSLLSQNGGGIEMAIFNNELYSNFVGNGIGKWNGSNWVDVAGTVVSTPVIYSMEVYNGNLFVAGEFNSLGGLTINDVASYNGTSWSNVSWSYGEAHHLKTISGNLYATTWIGNFNSTLGIWERVLKWNNGQWTGLGQNLIHTSQWPFISSLVEFNNEIYAGGSLLIDVGLPSQSQNLIKIGTPTSSISEFENGTNNSEIGVFDLLGRQVNFIETPQILIFHFEDGSSKRIYFDCNTTFLNYMSNQ